MRFGLDGPVLALKSCTFDAVSGWKEAKINFAFGWRNTREGCV
jgi:hypothetical protein